MARFSVPNVAGMRLAIGFLALGFMLLAEIAGRVVMYEEGLEMRIFDADKISGGAFAASLLLFGFMPWFLMVFGEREDVPAQTPLHPKEKPLNARCM